MQLQHFLSVEDLSLDDVQNLIYRGLAFKKGAFSPDLRDFFVANLFLENSTRTHKSFEVAENKLNMKVIPFDGPTSSLTKGETLYDTVLTLSAIGLDLLVIRSSEEAYYEKLVSEKNVTASLINAGDGSGQHPSQCLLDLMTIYEEFGKFEGLKVAIIGDLEHSRVARSNMQMLKRLGAELYFSGPQEWVSSEFLEYGKYSPIDELVEEMDVLMMLRVQHERHAVLKNRAFSKEAYHEEFGLTEKRGAKMKKGAIIMHPAPVNRDVEIADSLVEAPQSKILTQMKNGMFMRMAILEAVAAYRKEHHENLN